MVFSSLVFLCVFLPVVFGLYYLIPGTRKRNVLLVAASLIFYAYGEPIYVLLMIGSTVFNWLIALPLKSDNAKNRKAFLVLAIVGNLGVLGVFKYAGFAVSSWNAAWGLSIPVPAIDLPIGISFFTFQALSYVIDAYRGDVAVERNYLNVLLYISFFPQLIAGPIVRYHDIAQQIRERHSTWTGIGEGLRRFCVGLGKKVLIANTMAIVADSVFSTALSDLNVLSAWIGALAYMMQIYFDFSGYSDMAIGMGHMFGFDFKENFDYPYESRTIREFWRRWHISLSTWFKEYLYIPLGGNRKGKLRASINKIVVFFTCGLWHGASWTFVIWGLYHGLFLLIEEYVPMKKLPRAVGLIYAMLVVCVGFVIFRSDTIAQGMGIVMLMFSGFSFNAVQMSIVMQQLTPLFIFMFGVAIVAALPVKGIVVRWINNHAASFQKHAQLCSYAGAIVLLAVCILELSSGSYNPFIYFRF